MNNYCLTINVRSANKVLLDNMLVTLETFNENINEIETRSEEHTSELQSH